MKNWNVIQEIEKHIPNIYDYIAIPDGLSKCDFDMEESFVLMHRKISRAPVYIYIKTNNSHDRPIYIEQDCSMPFENTSYKSISKSFINRIKLILEVFSLMKEEDDLVRKEIIEKARILQSDLHLYQNAFENNLFIYYDIKSGIRPFIAMKIGGNIYNVDVEKKTVYLGSFCRYNSPDCNCFDSDLAIPLIYEREMRKLLEV